MRRIVTAIDRTTPKGARDAAIILLGFASALRRSELAALTVSDIEHQPGGVVVTVSRSKTDQEGEGQRVAVVNGQHAVTDPVAALNEWLDRRGRLLWSLPKGHIEAGETAEQAAVREVEEETGIIGRVVAPLGTIDFWFVAEDRRVHKTVHHFLMRALGGELSDLDVEVSEVAWVPLDELESRLAYADER
ncbi:MAG: NUDIX domain-containing protein, partial [Cellulomonas sp.]|nr:NUDIX domain-containing protein [Cellulomonas sp.]